MATDLDQYLEWLSAALFHPERMPLLGLIIESPRSAAALAAATGLVPDAVADHLAVLQSLDIVTVEGADEMVTYRLNEERVRRASDDLATIPNDVRSLSGRPGPPFRLPAADGQEVALADCLAQGPTIVWFSRGLACPICRRHRTQLTRGYAAFRALGAEVLEITPTAVERARFYLSNYDLAFPYLCDPSGKTAALYGVKRGESAPLLLLRVAVADWVGSNEITRELLHGPHFEPVAEEASGGAVDGFFIIDRSGLIRFADIGPYRGLPSNREIELQLQGISG